MRSRWVGSLLLIAGLVLLGIALWVHHDSEGGLRSRAAVAAAREEAPAPVGPGTPVGPTQLSAPPAGASDRGGPDSEDGSANVVGPVDRDPPPLATAPSVVSGLVTIPSQGLEAVLRPSVSATDLDVGVGHYPGTARPGQEGNFAVAAHRGLVPDLDGLQAGDVISVESAGRVYTYTWVESFVVAPEDVWVLDPVADERVLTLTTCHPRYSNAQRLVARFELTGAAPA